MDIDKIIRRKYSSELVAEKAGELLFKWPGALKVIDEIEKLRAVILGMDFWAQKGEDIVEVNSTDYSSINSGPNASEETIKATRNLIGKQLPDNANYVSFVLSSKT